MTDSNEHPLIGLRLWLRENHRMYVAEALRLREGDRGRLEAITRASAAPAGVARRARVVLLAADGVPIPRSLTGWG
jgi:hypothetical protein